MTKDILKTKILLLKRLIKGLQQSPGRENYIKKVEKQLGDSGVYDYDHEPFISTIHRTIEKIRKGAALKK